jgi:hypothetical protein
MPWLSTNEYDVVAPKPSRQIALLATSVLTGTFAAYAFLPTIGWANAVLTVLGLALLAGGSVLWSP